MPLIGFEQNNSFTGYTLTIRNTSSENEVDFGGAIFSDVTDELIGTTYTGGKTRVYWKDKEFESDYNLLKERFNDAELNFTSNTEDEKVYLIYVNKDTDPGAAYVFDRTTKETSLLYRPRPELPIEHLAEMQVVSYKSSDGLEIPAYLTIPKGKEATFGGCPQANARLGRPSRGDKAAAK